MAILRRNGPTLLLALVMLCWMRLGWAQSAPAQPTTTQSTTTQSTTTQATVEPGHEAALEPLKVPNTVDGLTALRQELAQEMAHLQPETQPASQTTSLPADQESARNAADDLYAALAALVGQIDQQIALGQQLEDLKDPYRVAAFAKELAGMQDETAEFEKKLAEPPQSVSKEEAKAVADEYEKRSQDLSTRAALQVERAKSLAAALENSQKLAVEVQKATMDLAQQVSTLAAQAAAAKTPEERQRALQQLRTAQLQASLPAFRAVAGKLSEERDTILQARAERRIPMLQTLVVRLGEWNTLVQKRSAQSERQRIESQLKSLKQQPTTAPYSRSYWELRLLELDAREALQKLQQNLQGRFPPAEQAALEKNLANEQAIWRLFMESLQRRSSEQVRKRYRQAGLAERDWQQRLERLRQLLDESADHQQELIAKIDEYDEQIRAREQTLNEQLNAYLRAHPEETKAQKYTPQYAASKTVYVEQARAARDEAAELTTRLRTAIEAVSGFVTNLDEYRSRLYWHYLFVPEKPVWAWRPQALRAEWKAETQARAKVLQTLQDGARAIGTAQWIVGVLAVALAAALALVVRRRALRYAAGIVERFEETKSADEEERATLAERLHLLAARLVARTAPLGWPALVAALCILTYDLNETTARVLLIGLAVLLVLVLSEALIHVLFLPGKPRQRLLRCSSVVAAYYRRWAMVLWAVTAVLVPLPLLLWLLNLSYGTRALLWAAYRLAALVVVLIFGLRRTLVLRVVGREEDLRHRWLFSLVSAAYWVLWAAVLGLLGLELAGYGALVAYVGTGVVQTLAVIFLAELLARYITELPLRLRKKPDEAAGSAVPAAGGTELGIGLALALFGWCVAAVAILIVLYIWGVRTVEIKALLSYHLMSADASTGRPAITVGRVLAAVVAIVVAVWVSRALRSFLSTRVYPVYQGLDRGSRVALNTMLHYLIVLIGLYFALVALRVPLGALTVVLGTLGLGVGLGLQPVFVNFISGLIILFERHVRVGDLIIVGDNLGEVTSISMRSTTAKTPDGIELVIPNSDLVSHNVINWTLHATTIRGHIKLTVAYGTDVELVKKLLADLLQRHPLVLRNPPPEVWFMEFGDSALEFEIAAWFATPLTRWEFTTTVRYEIARMFKEHNIEIPFPQRTLSTPRGGELSVRLVPPSPEPRTGDRA